MKAFGIYVAKILVLLLVILTVLDLIYTSVHYQARKRTKIHWVMNMHDQQLDYIVLGSSRVLFHVDADLINGTTGLNGYNLGDSDYELSEMHLILKKFFANGNRVKQIFLQVDNNWNDTIPSDIATASYMPYIHDRIFRDHYAKYGLRYQLYAYVPFIRYMYYGPIIGFRSLLNVVWNDRTYANKGGYIPLEGQIDRSKIRNESFVPALGNPVVAEIQKLIQTQQSQLLFFTAPTLKFPHSSFDFLSDQLKPYHNFTYDINDTALFWDNIHLNAEGSELFTRLFIQTYFPSNSIQTVHQAARNKTDLLAPL